MCLQYNSYFLLPVDVSQFPEYKTICPNPQDLGTIKRKLENNEYSTMNEFADDIRTCFNNGIAFNKNSKVSILCVIQYLFSLYCFLLFNKTLSLFPFSPFLFFLGKEICCNCCHKNA